MSDLFSQLGLWLNANEGVLEGIAVIIAVIAIVMPRFGLRIFKQNSTPDLSKVDPRDLPVHPAYLAAYTGVMDKQEGGSVFAPKFGRNKKGEAIPATEGEGTSDAAGRPVIAVFPAECPPAFEGRADYQGLAAILAEEIATGLDAIQSYDVIAGRVTRGFTGHLSDLGARYLVEGTIREGEMSDGVKSIRFIIRLVDVGSGRHLWSQRYTVAADDFYTQEDELVAQITAAVFERLQEAEAERASKADPDRLDAWSLSVLAFSSVAGTDHTGQLNAEALARKAVEQEPESGYAHAVLAATLVQKLGVNRATVDPKEIEDIRRAVSASRVFSPNDSLVLSIIGFVLTNLGDFGEAEDILERSIEMNPSNARGWAGLGRVLRNQGRVEEAVTKLERALRLAPRDSLAFLWWHWIGSCYMAQGDFNATIEASRHAIAIHRNMFWSWLMLAAALAQLGRQLEAEDALREGLTYNDEVTAENIDLWIEDSMGGNVDMSNLKEGLLKAGLS